MFVALSFIGKLPSYIIESIHQIRIYFDKDIYLIINDIESPFIESLNKYIEKTPHDLIFATMQNSYNVYGLRKPFFYQEAILGGQEDITKVEI
jgi:hypothetical protein